MYQCEQILAKSKETSEGWIDVEKDGVTLDTLLNNYRKVLVVLSHNLTTRWGTLDLSEATVFFGDVDLLTITLEGWLVAIGDLALPVTEGIPVVTRKTVAFNDLYAAGYKAALHHAMMAPDSQVTDADKHDVRVYRENTDYTTLHRNCLFTFNGLVHLTDRDNNGVYLKNAGKSFNVANENHIGIISFREIGEIDLIPITEDMVYTPHETGGLLAGAYIDTKYDLSEKTLLLVLGGYLHVLDNVYDQVGTSVVKINLNKVDLYKRYLESRRLIDVSSIEATWESRADFNNLTHVPVEEFFKDESLLAYLTLSQSFIVAVSSDNLYIKKHLLERASLPGRYRVGQKPRYPLQTEMGRLPEYLAVEEYGIWTICIQDNLQRTYRYETTDWRNALTVDGSELTVAGRHYSKGMFLEIGSDVLTFQEP